jgi:hypothetical protein
MGDVMLVAVETQHFIVVSYALESSSLLLFKCFIQLISLYAVTVNQNNNISLILFTTG